MLTLTNLISELIIAYIKALRNHKILRASLTLIFGFLTLITVLFIGLYPILQASPYLDTYYYLRVFGPVHVDSLFSALREAAFPFAFAIGALLLFCLASFTSVDAVKISRSDDLDIEAIRQERKEIEQRLSVGSKEDIVSTIQLNLNQLTEYYAINKSQARRSFAWSVFAIVAGLITLIGGVWLFYFRDTPNPQLTAITTISSVLIEFIGGAYFFLYNKSLDQLNFFYAQLVRLQDTMLSIKLMEDITNESKQIEIREQLITTLISRSSYEAQNSP